MIIDHDNAFYRQRWITKGANRFNGAFYYSKEIVKYIIPNIKTDRNWVTINTLGIGNYDLNHSIVFVHNNLEPERYRWLKKYKDVILVCGLKNTMRLVAQYGTPVYLPLSVKVSDVKKYTCSKTKEVAFVGRPSKARMGKLPQDLEMITNLPRTRLLKAMAPYRKIYAVGRTAIEAKILGCKVLPYDYRFPNPNIWRVVDCAEAVKILQKELDKIDG